MRKSTGSQKSFRPIMIIGTLFFIFGFITWMNSVLIPYLRIACELNNLESYLVAFSFYISYLTMAAPASKLLKLIGFKGGMAMGLYIMALGALIFIPAAITRTYFLFLIGLFVQGAGLTILQSASNPYITILGPIESAAKRISIMGICNKVAGIVAPIALGSIILKDSDSIQRNILVQDKILKIHVLDRLALRVVLPYLILACVLFLLGLIIYYSSLPDINTEYEDTQLKIQNRAKYSIVQFPQLILGVIAMFFYVGVEVIAGDTIISYGASQNISLTTAKFFTSLTLTGMIIGYLVGALCIPRFLNQNKALRISAVTGILFTLLAICLNGSYSVLCIALLGLSNALIFPAIWPQALEGLGRFTKTGSSMLIMAISGGAILPVLYGGLSDRWNPHVSYVMLIPCYAFILYYGRISNRMTNNSYQIELSK